MTEPLVQVRVPSLLASHCDGLRALASSGATARDVLDRVCLSYPALRVHLLDETGELRQHVLCYVGDVDTRWRDGLDTKVENGSEVTIVQAISGG